MDKPKILTLNLKGEVVRKLKEHKYNIYDGSLGKLIQTNNDKGEHEYCLLNHDFPDNLHEYDIVIVDAQYAESIAYNQSEHLRTHNKSENNTYLLSKHPQTVFDPRPHAARILFDKIGEMMRHDSLLLVMQGEAERITYVIVEENGTYPDIQEYARYHTYEFLPTNHLSANKSGTETTVVSGGSELYNFLKKYNSQFTYLNTFSHPTIWDSGENVNDPGFIPLVVNRDDEIVSHVSVHENMGIYLFPCLEDYSSFVVEFLESIAPSIHPTIFPESSKGS